MTPGLVRAEKHEQFGGAVTSVFGIVALRLAGFGRDRFAHLAETWSK